MHAKTTVRYICEHYIHTGSKYYFKTELLTNDTYKNVESLYWSKPRPITERTFKQAQKNGYPNEIVTIKRRPAMVITLDELRGIRDGSKGKVRCRRHRSSTH